MNSKYIRLSELVSLHHPKDKRSRFYKFWESFYEIPERVQAFSLIEKELSALDGKSWCFLKDEAKGYCFLKLIGCSDIRFIPEQPKII